MVSVCLGTVGILVSVLLNAEKRWNSCLELLSFGWARITFNIRIGLLMSSSILSLVEARQMSLRG